MTRRVGDSLLRLARAEAQRLSPAYFALVMATGIVSIAAAGAGMRWVAVTLFRFKHPRPCLPLGFELFRGSPGAGLTFSEI